MYISLNIVQEISLKKIYDEVTEGIFDMNNVGILEEIEKKKKWGMFILCYVFGQLFGLRNLCYSKISVVMLLGYRIVSGRVAQSSVSCLA